MNAVQRLNLPRNLLTWAMAAIVLMAAAYFGSHVSLRWLVLVVVGLGAVALLRQPVLGLLGLIILALIVPTYFGTGTEVGLYPVALLTPVMLVVWLLNLLRQRNLRWASSSVNKPLLIFLVAGLFSLLIGIVFWDPAVPRSGNFTVVQLAQWAIFAFSAFAFWLMGNLVHEEFWLRRLTFFYLALAGTLAVLRVMPGGSRLTDHIATYGINEAPFWLLLGAVAGGQLLFNRELTMRWRIFLLIVVGAVLLFAFVIQRKTLSHLAGVAPALGMLVWLRWPRLRPLWMILGVLSLTVFFSVIYQFAGGDAEWDESGGSRLVLYERVVEVTMRNPITGLGPAAYRLYARMRPLPYGRALWVVPQVNSHNNYVDLFSHVGVVGLALFFWFAVELFRLGFRLRPRFTQGFAAGYVNSMLATWAGALIVMLFADWILPFVYNIGFLGFQASVLVWLFLGGLITLEQVARQKANGNREANGSRD